MEKGDEEGFIPSCGHCEMHVVYRRISSMTEKGKQISLTNLLECTSFSSKPDESGCSLAGRLLYTRNGNFLFIQCKSESRSSGPRFVLVPCEISGKFNSNRPLKCRETEFVFVSCWVIVRDWVLVRMTTNDPKAPLRSLLLGKHLNPCGLQNEETGLVKILKTRLLCFSASTVFWVTSLSPCLGAEETGIKGLSLAGLVIHTSALVMHKTNHNEKALPTKRSKNEPKETHSSSQVGVFGIDEVLRSSENSTCESSFSIIIRSVPDGRQLTIFFPEASLSINRHVLGWKSVYRFENVVPGSVLIHGFGESPTRKKCLIASRLTSIAADTLAEDIPRSVSETPTLLQIEKVLGFGVFEIKTSRTPIKLFLHNSNVHETSLGCSISRGSVLWVRNFRVITTTLHRGSCSVPVGISVEPYSDWGLERHSRFSPEKKAASQDVIWGNLPMHIQTIGHEYLEFNNFSAFDSGVQRTLLQHPWDIRNLCYLHYSLYVDIFNIVGAPPSEESHLLPISLVQIISTLSSDTASTSVTVSDKTKLTLRCSSSLICSRTPGFQPKITHPSQTLELRSDRFPRPQVSCTDPPFGLWRIAPIEEWVKLVKGLQQSSQKAVFTNSLLLDYTLSIEFLYHVKSAGKRASETPKSHISNSITSLRCLFVSCESSPVYMGYFGNFLAQIILDGVSESSAWISNVYFIKTPSLTCSEGSCYPLFIRGNSRTSLSLSSGYSRHGFERKLVFIKKAMLRLYDQKISFFAHILDIACINFEDCFPKPPTSRRSTSGDSHPRGILLFVSGKEVQVPVEGGSRLYFHCLPFFKTFQALSKLDSLSDKSEVFESQIEKIQVPYSWFCFGNVSRFMLVLDRRVRPDSQVLLSPRHEEEFFEAMNASSHEQAQHLVMKELVFPSQLSSYQVGLEQSKKTYIEIKLLGNDRESILWPEESRYPFSFKAVGGHQGETGSACYSVFDVKYWTDLVYEWHLFASKSPLVYRSIQAARRDAADLFLADNPKSPLGTEVAEMHISLDHVKVLDIVQFNGFNPQNLSGRWSVLRVTTDQNTKLGRRAAGTQNTHVVEDPPWNSGWIDIWFSEQDTLRHDIQLILPGETISLSHIKVERVASSSPPLSPVSSTMSSILVETSRQDRPVYYNRRDHTQYTPDRKKYTLSGSWRTQHERSRAGGTLSIFNNGATIFRLSVRNSAIRRNKAHTYSALKRDLSGPGSDLLLSHLYFSPTSLSEVTSYCFLDPAQERYIRDCLRAPPDLLPAGQFPRPVGHPGTEARCASDLERESVKFADRWSVLGSLSSQCVFDAHAVPSPYFLAPEGSPITQRSLSLKKSGHASYIAFNRAYCVETELAADSALDDLAASPTPLQTLDRLKSIDPDQVFSLKGSILHIQQIDLSWFCLNCLRAAARVGEFVCVCGADLGGSSLWKSLTIHLIGALEIEESDSKPKLLPFVMTNWNVIRLLAYVNKADLREPDPKLLYYHTVELATTLWNLMDGSSGVHTLYSFGKAPPESEDFPIGTESSSESFRPVGIMGQVQLFGDKKSINIPNDPVSNLEMEACLRCIGSSDGDVQAFAYLHVIRWKLRNIQRELEEKLESMNLTPQISRLT